MNTKRPELRRFASFVEYRLILWTLMRTSRDIRELSFFQNIRKICLDRLLVHMLRRRLRRTYPDSALLINADQFETYVERWQRHLNLVVFTPVMRALDGLSVFRNYTFEIDADVQKAMVEKRPVVLCSYHRHDLADLFASMILHLSRRSDLGPLRIVALRLDALKLREAIWSLFGDLFEIEIVILSTKDAEFPRKLKNEFSNGALFFYMCDMPVGQGQTAQAEPDLFLGLPCHIDMGLLKLALGVDATVSWLSLRGSNVRLQQVPAVGARRPERYAALRAGLLDCVAQEAAEDDFLWVGWLEHTQNRYRIESRRAQ